MPSAFMKLCYDDLKSSWIAERDECEMSFKLR